MFLELCILIFCHLKITIRSLISNFIYSFVPYLLLFKLDLSIFLYLVIFFKEMTLDLSNNFKIIIICVQIYYLVQFHFGFIWSSFLKSWFECYVIYFYSLFGLIMTA